MKLMDVGIAVPFVEYHISVGCRIRRRAMIMEWVIIQMIAAALQHKEYGELPASAILRTVFGISDADRLVRPVMISMMSTGLISAAGLTDDSSLDEIRLSDCGLTDEGRLMLQTAPFLRSQAAGICSLPMTCWDRSSSRAGGS